EKIVAPLRPQLDTMKGIQIGYFINKKGYVHDLKIDVPKSFPAGAEQVLQGLNQSFESLGTPLPDDAVGLGAKWQVLRRDKTMGVDVVQSMTFTLKARSGSKATLDITVSQLLASDVISLPGMSADASARVKSFSSNGAGTLQIDSGSMIAE